MQEQTYSVEELLLHHAKQVEAVLTTHLSGDPDYQPLIDAQIYSLTGKGKRIRPFLVIESCLFCGGTTEAALPFAKAVEMIHTYSLIHDDLPCMDNDTLRRGRPTNHVVFGESTALLAGDSLLTDAFGVIAGNELVSPEFRVMAAKILSSCAGTEGMASGQAIDLAGTGKQLSLEQIAKLHDRKTGALIRASVLLGQCAAQSDDQEISEALTTYANSIGRAFQILDDLLDATATSSQLGKTAGKDDAQQKSGWLSRRTLEQAAEDAKELTVRAQESIQDYPGSDHLVSFAGWLLERKQ